MPHLQFNVHKEIEKLDTPDLTRDARESIMERLRVAVVAYADYGKLYVDTYEYSPSPRDFYKNMGIIRPIWADHYLRSVHLH